MLSIRSIQASRDDLPRLKRALLVVLVFVLLLWLIKIIANILGFGLWQFGVIPGSTHGLIGLFTAPLVHGSFEHLISNTPAIMILGTALVYGYPRSWWIVIPVIWVGTGLGVWLTARPVYHFGASGLTYGFMFFIFVIGILRRDRLAIVLSLLVFFLYGTMIWGVFPHQPGISYETHLWGAGIGVMCALLLRKRDPAPIPKRYEWEDEEFDDDEIGNSWQHSEPINSNKNKNEIN